MKLDPSAQDRRLIALILTGSIVIKLALALYLGTEFHGDTVRAVNFGYGVHDGAISIRTHFDNTKTWLGPVLWYQLFELAGPWGLKLFNLLVFVVLLGVQYRTGRRFYGRTSLLLALFLFAFYVGTHRNVMAGEPDDMTASLLFGIGLLVFLKREAVLGASMLMGLGFLFKFWTAIFFAGLCLFLLSDGRWRSLLVAVVAFVAPFIVVNLVDGFASLSALLWSIGRQSGQDDWGYIAWRLFSTGLLPAALVSAWALVREPSRGNRLCFLVPIPYLGYVLLMRDAHAASAVMMLCMVYFGFLIAQFLQESPLLGSGVARRRVMSAALAAYVAVMAGLAYYGADRITYPIELREGGAGREISSRSFRGPQLSGRALGRPSVSGQDTPVHLFDLRGPDPPIELLSGLPFRLGAQSSGESLVFEQPQDGSGHGTAVAAGYDQRGLAIL